MRAEGVSIEVISGLRSWKAQAAIYALGRTKPGLKGGYGPANFATRARPGSSWHQYGLAVDFGLFRNGVYLDGVNPRLADRLYRIIAKIAVKHSVEWAGNWKRFTETPHFQVTFGLTIAQARTKLIAAGYDIQKIV
jgi:peptidoglycan L-alanyl-D-glutamate endopeptidase CwlK